MKIINLLSGIQILPMDKETVYAVTGSGSVFTYSCSGTASQTAKVEGSIDGEIWHTVVEFTIEPDGKPLSKVLQHTWPYLKVTGNAQVKIARGAA